jgi:hypothetical protein
LFSVHLFAAVEKPARGPSSWDTTATWVNSEPDKKNPYELDPSSLPPRNTIDTFGICFGGSVATAMNFEMCKQGKISDCSKLPESQQVSALGIARYAVDPTNGSSDQIDSNFDQLRPGGGGNAVLDRAMGMLKVPTESCVSLAKIAPTIPAASAKESQDLQAAIWSDLETAYNGYRQALKDKCDDCASKFYQSAVDTVSNKLKLEEDEKSDPNLKNDNAKILKAFKEDTFSKALNTILYPPECGKTGVSIPNRAKIAPQFYPQDGKKHSGMSLIPKIKSILGSTQRPVVLDGICAFDCGDKDNKKWHSAVIAGYRKICKKNDPNNCREALKVINTGGAGWDKYHNNGWLDAEALLGNVEVVNGTLSWIEDRDKIKSTL